jgi:hypothetical protein
VHLTFVVGDKVQKKDLCEVCAPIEDSFMSTREPKCDYCGAPADSGWSTRMISAGGTKHEETHFVCEQCQKTGRTKRA